MKLILPVAIAFAVTACSSGGSTNSTSGSGSTSGGGGSTTGGSTSGTTTGSAVAPELTFNPNPVVFSPSGDNLQNLRVTSASGLTVSPSLTFQFVPDAGGLVCFAAQESAPPTGGGAIALTCNLPGQISVSANAAGTVVTFETFIEGSGSPTCGAIYYSCQSDSDCCSGLGCTLHDAGPSKGEVDACDYPWAVHQ